jgi:hypothetical protein
MPGDMAVDIIEVAADTGEVLMTRTPVGWSAPYVNLQSVPGNAKSYSVTVAVQKKRYVEFLVKPESKP